MTCSHAPSPNPRITDCVKCGRQMPSPRGRNLDFEQDFIRAAASAAGVAGIGFENAVQARLDMGAREYGESFIEYTLGRFVREIGEEGEDVAGWSVGAAQCRALERLDPERREEFLHWLHHLVGLGAQVRWATMQLAELLD